MLRWLLVCADSARRYYAVTKLVPTNELASQTPRNQSNTGDALETTFPNLPIRPLAGAGGSNRVQIINDARITPLNRQDVGSERPGTIVLYGTELKPGEEKSVQPDRLITQPFVYIAVQVDYDPKKPALSYPLSGTPDNVIPYQVPLYVKDPVTLRDISNYFALDNSEKVYTRWKEGMPCGPTTSDSWTRCASSASSRSRTRSRRGNCWPSSTRTWPSPTCATSTSS